MYHVYQSRTPIASTECYDAARFHVNFIRKATSEICDVICVDKMHVDHYYAHYLEDGELVGYGETAEEAIEDLLQVREVLQ
jgi:hypothetical protein